jgi:hypothetical protein
MSAKKFKASLRLLAVFILVPLTALLIVEIIKFAI